MRLPDRDTHDMAVLMMGHIQAFWARRGFHPKLWLEKRGERYYIRSDMVNGKPRKR